MDTIETTAVVPDGKTLLIGGKKIHRESSGTTKRPVLGDLPLIGRLFRSAYKITDTKNVLILIKPTINPKTNPPPTPPPLDPDDPLPKKLQEKFENSTAPK